MEDSALKNPSKVLIIPKRKLVLLTEPTSTILTPKNPGESAEIPRIIDLGDKSAKMALHRQLAVDGGVAVPEHSRGQLHYCVRMTDTSGKEFFIPKLPPGTILVKQDNKIVQKPVENAAQTIGKRLGQQINAQVAKPVVQPEKNK